MSKTERADITRTHLKQVGLTDAAERRPARLSGGMQQRVGIARAFAIDPPIMLLDEPLNNLDIAHSVEMMKHLENAAAQFGRTIIVVLHDINFAARYADYIVAVKHGMIEKEGTPEQIMKNEILSEIFNTEIEVIEGPHGKIACYH